MKKIALFLLILLGSYAGDFFPDENDTFQADMNTSISDGNTTYYNNLIEDESLSGSETNETGNIIFKDVNFSDPSSLYNTLNQNKEDIVGGGESFTNTLSERNSSYATTLSNLSSASYTYQKANNADSNSTLGMITGKEFIGAIQGKMLSRKYIQCYISRKLNAAYYCPLPTKDQSYYVGGDITSDADEAKETCDEECYESVSCKAYPVTGKSLYETDTGINKTVNENAYYEVSIDPELQLVKLSLLFSYEDDNETLLEDDNTTFSTPLYIRYDLFIDENQTTFNNKIKLEYKTEQINLHFSGITGESLKVKFYKPFYIDIQNTEYPIEGVKLDQSIRTYADVNYYFCPHTQFVTNANECDGEIKSVTINAIAYDVCVSSSSGGEESIYHAYYTQDACQSICYEREECAPTYKHIVGYNSGMSIPSDALDTEIGCVDDDDNRHCIDQVCIDKYTSYEHPVSEKVWHKDDEVVYTVKDGVEVEGTDRPKIDAREELP